MNVIIQNYSPHSQILNVLVVKETTNRNLFLLRTDINPLVDKICRKYNGRSNQSDFELKVIFERHTSLSKKN